MGTWNKMDIANVGELYEARKEKVTAQILGNCVRKDSNIWLRTIINPTQDNVKNVVILISLWTLRIAKKKDSFWKPTGRTVNEVEEIVYDLCIIGAGFFGSAAARHASGFPQQKICLIGLDEPAESELENRSIFSSHYDEGRIVKVSFSSPAFQKLSRRSISRLTDLEKLSGIKFYNPVGFMSVGKKGTHAMRNLEDISAAVESSLIKIFDNQLMSAMYPFLKMKDDEYALLDHTGAGIISARKMLEAERNVAREQGCQILFDEVKDIHPLMDNLHTVETTMNGQIRAKRILFTTGAFTNVNEFSVLPQLETYVYKEEATMVRIPSSEAERLSSMTGIVLENDDEALGFYILPPVMYPDGRYYLKVGKLAYDSGKGLQTAEEIKEWFLSKDEKPGEKELLSKPLFEALPGLVTDGIFRKLCVTCETPTDLPYIDQITPTITIAVAGNGWGATTAEEIGRLAACLSLTGSWDSEIPKALFEIVVKENAQ